MMVPPQLVKTPKAQAARRAFQEATESIETVTVPIGERFWAVHKSIQKLVKRPLCNLQVKEDGDTKWKQVEGSDKVTDKLVELLAMVDFSNYYKETRWLLTKTP